jgi:hypothetical protein
MMSQSLRRVGMAVGPNVALHTPALIAAAGE